MRIQNMFHDDINRQINGVIKVDQDANDVIEQEVREYVITKELRKHFSAFFNYYSDAFDLQSCHRERPKETKISGKDDEAGILDLSDCFLAVCMRNLWL